MKVLIVIPSLCNGGAERVASLLSTGLSGEGHDVYLGLAVKAISYPFSGELVDFGIKDPYKRDVASRFLSTVELTVKLRRLKKKIDPDVTVSFLEVANIPNVLSGSKTIVSVREFKRASGDRSAQRRVAERLMKLLYNRANKVVVNSMALGISMEKDYGVKKDKIKVIYNPVDIGGIIANSGERLDDELASVFESPVIITAGRLTRQKAHWNLIRAFAEAKKAVPDAKLVVLGDGELKGFLQELSAGLGIRHDVIFAGFQKNPFRFISKAAVFAFTSLWEGFPNALLEAMACGVPVISTDCPSGPREILSPDTDFHIKTDSPEYAKYGILMPVFDGEIKDASAPLVKEEKIWADAMVEMLKNSALRVDYGAKAKARASDFNMAGIIRQWEDLILNC